MITPLVLLALLAPLNAGADFAKGVAAYQAGDYATAAQEFFDIQNRRSHARTKLEVKRLARGIKGLLINRIEKFNLAASQIFAFLV